MASRLSQFMGESGSRGAGKGASRVRKAVLTSLILQGGILPFEISPTPETAASLSLALDMNEEYFRLLEKAVQLSLAYVVQERTRLQSWSEEQAMKLAEAV